MVTLWKVFHGNKDRGYKVAYLRLMDNGALLGVGKESILLSRAELADLFLTLQRAYNKVYSMDVQRMQKEEEERRKKAQERQAMEKPDVEDVDLTAY